MVVDEEEDEGEDGGEDDGGEEGGFSPFPFEGLELSPCNLEVLSSQRTFTISFMENKAYLKVFSSSDILSTPQIGRAHV